ncbi:hypothetical protein Sjap_026316 [Stephania japonica]|uniref:Uncharacterized protein n=1 Tax=Stephania japonica TaxID=461633 RepID=A0AAP0HKC2_9MAGN
MRHGGDTCDRESEDFQARSRQATQNRNTEVEGPGTGPSKHGGGSVSFATTQERLDRLQSRRQELTQATPEQSVDDEAVYLNVAGECSKGRVYGLGSVGRKKRRYGTPGASTSRRADVDSSLGGRRGGYSGGGELGGGYGGFGAGGLGAYRDKRDAYIDQGAALEGQEASVMTDYIIKPQKLMICFDDIILLSDGQVVYQGPRENVLEFFESMGFKCMSYRLFMIGDITKTSEAALGSQE